MSFGKDLSPPGPGNEVGGRLHYHLQNVSLNIVVIDRSVINSVGKESKKSDLQVHLKQLSDR